MMKKINKITWKKYSKVRKGKWSNDVKWEK